MALLRIKNGVEAGKTLTLRKGTLRVGRSESNDIQIVEPSVSGSHCEVALDYTENLRVRDLGSSNGTFIEGRRISEGLLKPWQTLQLGVVELVLEQNSPETLPPAAPTDSAETMLAQPRPSSDPSALYLVSMPGGGYRAPADWAGHASLRTTFGRGVELQQRYVLERELGRGAMGQVFLARDIRLERSVAVKVILAVRGGEVNGESILAEGMRLAFEEEAQVGANLKHPAIATVYDYGFHRGNPFTVFEYVEGETLQDMLRRRRRIPLEETRLIVAPLAQGLDYAHAQHIVHRDLKPANIRATAQGYFKILDLGLAKRLLQAGDEPGFAGTPAYASPEQAAELPVDSRTDQYALALIVFEMLTGQRPFRADTVEEMLRLHREGVVPDPKSLAQDLPEAVSATLLRALHKDPNQRFVSCEAFAVALGCQFLSAAAPAAPILLEADVRTRPDFWRAGIIGQRQHLALLSDCIWCDQGWEIRSWPVGDIVGLGRVGRDLQFGLAKSGGGKQRFRFSSADECASWHQRITAQQQVDASRPASDRRLQKPSSVVLLRQRPNMRLQLLGAVEAEGKRRREREAGLRIRGALVGADAVIGLEEERLPELGKTVRRTAGTAVRAVEPAGRSELRAHWLNDRITRLTTFMFWLLGASLALKLLGVFVIRLDTTGTMSKWQPGGQLLRDLSLGATVAGLIVLDVWPLLLAVALRGLRWPQLMPAATITFPIQQALPVVGVVTTVIVASIVGDWATAGRNLLALVVAVERWSLLVLGLLLGRRIWRTYCEVRQTQWSVGAPQSPGRTWAGYSTIAVSLAMAVVWVAMAVGTGVRLGKAQGNTVSSFLVAHSTLRTNDLPDIGASWTLSSGWHEDASSAHPGLRHGFRFTNNLVLAVATVQDTRARPQALRGNDQAVLVLARDREFRGLARPSQLGDAQPVETSGMTWSEMEFSAAPATEPNAEQHYLLRAHADSNCQASVLIWCRKELWDSLKEIIRSAADGFHPGILPAGRTLKASGLARPMTSKGTKQPYLWRLPGTWQLRKDPRMDLWLVRADGIEVTVLLEDLSAALERAPVSVSQAAAAVSAQLNTEMPGFQLLGREDVEVGDRRGQMLHFRYTVGKLTITELRVLVLDSGWLYHLRALSSKSSPDLSQLEQVLAGFEFPCDSVN